MREDPPPDARCRDKFLVQSTAISPEHEHENVAVVVSNLSAGDNAACDRRNGF